MAEGPHLSELQLLALLDDELPPTEATSAQSHVTRCFFCHRLYEGFRRENDILRAAAGPDVAGDREVSHELECVVAAGLVFSLGLLGFRHFFGGMAAAVAKTPMPDALPVLSDLGFRLLSLLDIERAGSQIAFGGFVIMMLLGICLASIVIRRLRAGIMPFVLAAIAGLGAFNSPAEALDVVTGDSARCRVAPDQVVNDDLLLLCEKATVVGTVRGDLYFFGRSLTVSGHVDGDVFAVGNELNLDGSVGLSLRGVAQTVRIGGELGRGLTAAGRRIAVLPGASVGGGVLAAGRRLSVAGPVRGSILATGRTLELNAPIEGDLKFTGETFVLGSRAAIGGSANYTGPTEPEREPGAPNVTWTEPEPEGTNVWGESRASRRAGRGVS